MGIRMDQYAGLTSAARQLVAGENVLDYVTTEDRLYSDGHHEIVGPTEVYKSSVFVEVCGSISGAWIDEVAPLHRYHLPDGSVLEEYVQDEVWDSGPIYYIALQYQDSQTPVPQSLWSERDMYENA